MTYETRTMSILVIPEGEPSYSEQGTEVRIATEAGGEFVEVEQTGCSGIAMPKWCCACMGAGSARARRLGLIGHRDGMGWLRCGVTNALRRRRGDMGDELQDAINALREIGKEREARAVEELRARHTRTMDDYHAGQRASYLEGLAHAERAQKV